MAKRGRNLAALAALGALGYGYMARGDKQDGTKVPVSDAVPVGTRARDEDERDGTTPAAAPAAAPATSVDELQMADIRYRENPVVVPAGPRAPTRLGGRTVSKEELAKSGLSLRDFLNKERGLTRRESSPPPKSSPPSVREIFRSDEGDFYNLEPGRKPLKKGGAVKKMASGGSTNGASRRGDGIAQRGKTKGRMV